MNTSKMRIKEGTNPGGFIIEVAGLAVLLFGGWFGFALAGMTGAAVMGLVGLVLLIMGGRRCIRYSCPECRAVLSGRKVKKCPSCGVSLRGPSRAFGLAMFLLVAPVIGGPLFFQWLEKEAAKVPTVEGEKAPGAKVAEVVEIAEVVAEPTAVPTPDRKALARSIYERHLAEFRPPAAGSSVSVRTTTGRTLEGTFVSVDAGAMRLKFSGGEFELSREQVHPEDRAVFFAEVWAKEKTRADLVAHGF